MLSVIALASVLNYKAKAEISSKALLLMQSMNSVRCYSNTEVSPQLVARLKPDEFLPQTVPAYSANKVFDKLRSDETDCGDYSYKEAMLNPTNIRDKSDEFETGLVADFCKKINTKQLQGFRSLGGKEIFYIARPISVTASSCLRCHSTPDAAPKDMIKIYGTINGFGWKLNEVLGTQIVSVPASQVLQKARQSFVVVMGIVAMVFAVTILMANLWLKQYIIRPIKNIVLVAEAMSTGDLTADFDKKSNDEIGSLVEVFTRIKLSLAMGLKSFSETGKQLPNLIVNT
ncbi:DUF3365 domain-containing protein [Microcoleus sp. ARI1-B5]|uniref:Tll0287-like domain-containing protein n=1 Tax=unclassified Microcoleus TaxID=2642155 RepID=UPI002FD45190